jgi:hypothetical protein
MATAWYSAMLPFWNIDFEVKRIVEPSVGFYVHPQFMLFWEEKQIELLLSKGLKIIEKNYMADYYK